MNTKEPLTLYVNYHGTTPIEKIDIGDWIDLRLAEDTFLEKGKYYELSLGISMKLPDGYEAHVAPRSSTYRKYGILMVNGIGIIDNSYSGNDDIWCMPAIATKDITIEGGERIAQFRIVAKQPPLNIISVDYLEGPNRGGLGSTGRK